ncbi:MAG: 2-hydroxyacyl-CoA dehydratase [Epsilonproteobacteria bacterium]|nr:2-hydroxyacyl-CoA dehydratase [Campylobacterota bacterium]
MIKESEALNEFRNIRKDLPEYLKKINKPVMGYFETYVPEEIIYAAGMHPLRISPNDRQIAIGGSKIESFACSVSINFLDQLLNGTLSFLKGVIFSRYCDSLRAIADIWQENAGDSFYHFIPYPTISTKESINFLSDELKKLADHISDYFNIKIDEEMLTEAIRISNKKRLTVLKFYDLIKKEKIVISSADFFSIISLATIMDSIEYTQKLEQLMKQTELTGNRPIENSIKVAISGIMLESTQFFEIVDKTGMRMVTDDLMFGSRAFKELVIKTKEGPCHAISKRYLNKIPCSTKGNIDLRIDELIKDCKEAGVKGVIFYLVTFCDSEECEFPILRKRLQAEGIPVIGLEGGYRVNSEGQFLTRLEAFAEQIGEEL